MMEIPTAFVALSALAATLVLLCGNGVSVKVLSLSLFSQFMIYVVFTFIELPIETRQFIARANNITVNLALIIIVLGSRFKHG